MANWKDIPWLERVEMEAFTRQELIDIVSDKSLHEHNRPLNTRRVMSFAEVILAGEYHPNLPTQAPLCFTPDNKCLNGLTRMNGAIQADVASIKFPVIRGIPMDAYKYLDLDSNPRSVKDAHYDRENMKRDQSRADWLHGLLIGDTLYRSPKILARKMIDGTYAREIQWAGKHIKVEARQGKAPYAVAFMYVFRCNQKVAKKWVGPWVSGSHLPEELSPVRDEAVSQEEGLMRGGGRRYTHEEPTFKLLNALAKLHNPRGEFKNDEGFKFWSDLAEDGAWMSYVEQRGAPKKSNLYIHANS